MKYRRELLDQIIQEVGVINIFRLGYELDMYSEKRGLPGYIRPDADAALRVLTGARHRPKELRPVIQEVIKRIRNKK
jgi:hypothetical protein